MKNPIIILLVVVVAVLGIGGFMYSKTANKADSMVKEDEAMMPKEEESMEPTDAMMQKDMSTAESDKMVDDTMASSRYVPYSKSAFESASSSRRVLFFYASWCSTCKPADANFIQNVSQIPDDVTVFRVNYNDPETDQEEKDLAKKYGITYQHTFVQIDAQGKEVSKWNGGQINELLSNIK